MGASFICMSIANFLSAFLGSYLEKVGYIGLFSIISFFILLTGFSLILLKPKMEAWGTS